MQLRLRQLRNWLLRFFRLFNRKQREREFAEELESHLALHMEGDLLKLSWAEPLRQTMRCGDVKRESARHW